MAAITNLLVQLETVARRQPERCAVVYPQGRKRGQAQYGRLTFGEVQHELDSFAQGFLQIGVERGMRVAVMVRPGREFLPLLFSLLKIGAIPVLIDPGMGRGNLLRCLAQASPTAFVGVPLAHVARLLFPRYFRSVRINVTIGRRLFWGGHDLDDLRVRSGQPVPFTPPAPEEPAAIVFTTGSTGPPKGVVYTHGMFAAQCTLLRDLFQVGEQDVDLAGFALFAVFSLPLGATVVIPEMDPTQPAKADPPTIVAAVTEFGATFSFGSPALWHTVSRWCAAQQVTLPSLRRVTMAGAPIPPTLHRRMLSGILPAGADVYTPYGATEGLPVTCFQGSQVLAETAEKTAQGRGYCVGAPVPGVRVKVIAVTDAPLPRWAQVRELPLGEIGEIVVSGPNVSRTYYELPARTVEHKIYETDDVERGPFWHRMGDLGYLDEQGRLWFCGRKGHRVMLGERMLCTVCCEAIFNQDPRVYRSALVGLGPDRQHQTPVIIIEPEPEHFPRRAVAVAQFRAELLARAQANPLTAEIREVLFHRRFPVDIRHNAKIFREQLTVWAARQRRG